MNRAHLALLRRGVGRQQPPAQHASGVSARASGEGHCLRGYYALVSDILQEAGPKSGQYAATFECVVNECDGRVCCNLRKVYQ